MTSLSILRNMECPLLFAFQLKSTKLNLNFSYSSVYVYTNCVCIVCAHEYLRSVLCAVNFHYILFIQFSQHYVKLNLGRLVFPMPAKENRQTFLLPGGQRDI